MRRAVALVVLAAAFGACAYEGGTTRPYRARVAAEPQATGGAELYARDCAWCHGSRGQGTDIAPDLVTGMNGPALTHFTLTTGRMPLDYPEQRMTRRDPLYDTDEIDDIVDYVEGFGQPGPDVPELDLATADLSLGQRLYQQNCAACHATTGIGGALAPSEPGELREEQVERPATIAPELHDSSAVEIAEATITGPGQMPVFHGTLSDEEVEAIVRYAVYLQDPDNPGGAPTGGIGPVAEGFIGWIPGLGVLILIMMWLGTKVGENHDRG